jgi:hypothetical protein
LGLQTADQWVLQTVKFTLVEGGTAVFEMILSGAASSVLT